MLLIAVATFFGGLICFGLIRFALCYLHEYRLLLRSKCFRGPEAYPIVGNGYLVFGKSLDILTVIEEQTTKYESPFRIWAGHRLYFAIHEPEHTKAILTSPDHVEKDASYDMLKPWFGDGLVSASASIWKSHRKAIQPTFSLKILETYIPIFNKNAYLLAEKFEMGGEFNINHYVARYTLDSISETTMGVSLNALQNEECAYTNHAEGVINITYQRMMKPWFYLDCMFYLSSLGKTYRNSIQYMRDFADNVLERAKQNIGKEFDTQPRKSFMGQLLSSTEGGIKFNDQQIRDHVSTMIATGNDTAANTLAFALFLLANHPDIQEKVCEELHRVYGDRDSEKLDITLQDLNNLEYLDLVLKETMRLFPVTALLGRVLGHDTNIGEYTLPAGCSVIMAMFNVHRDEKYWPKPLEFIPERFLPDHPMGSYNRLAYMPFSIGPRNCIGFKYANLAIKTVLSILLLKYEFKTRQSQVPADIKLLAHLTMKPMTPIMLIIQKRIPPTSKNLPSEIQ